MDNNHSALPPECSAIDHIAVAVNSINQARRLYELLGGLASEPETVTEQGVTVLPVAFEGTRIELLEPLVESSPVGRFIAKRGEGLHHIAIRVDDIGIALEACKKSGLKAIDNEPRQGAEGRLIAFLDPRTTGGVLIELTQKTVAS